MSEESSKEKVVSCNGMDGENLFSGHPKIYIRLSEGEQKPCPYCGKILG